MEQKVILITVSLIIIFLIVGCTDSTIDGYKKVNNFCSQIEESMIDSMKGEYNDIQVSCVLEGRDTCRCVTTSQGVELTSIVDLQTGKMTVLKPNGTIEIVNQGSSSFSWKYFESSGANLYFSIKERYNPLRLHEIESIIVYYGATHYGYEEDNTIPFKVCSSSPDEITLCAPSIGIKNRGFSDKKVTIYVLTGIGSNLDLQRSYPLSELKQQGQAKKVLKFDDYIPPIDDYGFVDMKYVDRTWCWVETDKSEYGDSKPECEKVVNKIKEKVKIKMDKEKPILERRACFINCENRLRKEQLGVEIKPEEEQYCSSDCCVSFMEDEGDYMKYLETAYPVYGSDKARYLQCSEELLDEFLQSK